jgi:hypothetical protein
MSLPYVHKSKTPIYERAVEETMAEVGRGIELRLTGHRLGLTYEGWDLFIRQACRENLYGTPRCLRWRQWDAATRLAEVHQRLQELESQQIGQLALCH